MKKDLDFAVNIFQP